MTAISTSGHPALRRTRTAHQLDAYKSLTRVNTVRCAVPIGTHNIWREIWLDRLDDQSRLVGRLDAGERRFSPSR